MDTKSKSSLKKNAGIILAIAGILLISLVMILAYPIFDNQADQRYTAPFEDTMFLEELLQYNYVLNLNLQEKISGETLDPSDIYFDEASSEISSAAEEFSNLFFQWENTLLMESNLDYFIQSTQNNTSLSNSTVDLEEFINHSNTFLSQNDYQYVIAFSYDAQGNLTLNGVEGADFSQSQRMLQYISQYLDEYTYTYGDTYSYVTRSLSLEKPRNVTIVYAVPTVLAKDSPLYDQISWAQYYSYYRSDIHEAILAACILSILWAVLLMAVKKMPVGNHTLIRLPLEACLAGYIVLFAIAYEGFGEIAIETMSQKYTDTFSHYNLSAAAIDAIIHGGNILCLFLILSLLFIITLSFHQIRKLGIRMYLRQKLLVVQLFLFLKDKIAKRYKKAIEIDFSLFSRKKLFILFLLNLAIILLCCSFWFIGIFLLIPYEILVYIAIKKYLKRVREEYDTLLDATEQISQGHLETKISDDIKTFQFLKQKLEQVQDGFKRSVEEEVKSQNMKTELITNVSHDLKTPLTAIITYIDLLKDPHITDQQRQSYLETLEKKSLRLKTLIEDLFEISKANSKNVKLDLQNIDIISLMKQVKIELEEKINQSAVDFHFRMPEEKIQLTLDSQKMYRVFENLLVNMTKYAMPHSRAYIDIQQQEETVSIIFKNISAAPLEFSGTDITERFVRGDRARNTEGSGLGLAIAKSFVELQGGQFQVLTDDDIFKVILTFSQKVNQ